MPSRFRRQLTALNRKNMLLLNRRKGLIALELAMPAALIILLGLVDLGFVNEPPQRAPTDIMRLQSSALLRETDVEGARIAPPLPVQCEVFDSAYGRSGYGQPLPDDDATDAWCLPLVFAPYRSLTARQVMAELAKRNGYREPTNYVEGAGKQGDPPVTSFGRSRLTVATLRESVIGFPTIDSLTEWLRFNNGRVGVAVVFGNSSAARGSDDDGVSTQEARGGLTYELWYNQSSVLNGWCARGKRAHTRDGSRLLFPQLRLSHAAISVLEPTVAVSVSPQICASTQVRGHRRRPAPCGGG